MFRKTVRKDERAILKTPEGDFKAFLMPGEKYRGTAEIYKIGSFLNSQIELDILLQNEKLAEEVEVFEISDNEVILYTRNNSMMHMLDYPGKYAIWKAPGQQLYRYDTTSPLTDDKKIINWARKGLLSGQIGSITIEPHEEALLYTDRQLVSKVGPGVYYFWKQSRDVTVERADLRSQQMDITGQELLTKDKITLRLSFIVTYKVSDIKKALGTSVSYYQQIYTAAQLALRDYVGSLSLEEILANKDKIAAHVQQVIVPQAEKLGITVETCGAKDIILPGEIKDILNQVLIAEKKAQANVITRREETASMRNMLNTARLMEENKTLYRLREMEHIEKIAANIDSIEMNSGGELVKQLRKIAGAKKGD